MNWFHLIAACPRQRLLIVSLACLRPRAGVDKKLYLKRFVKEILGVGNKNRKFRFGAKYARWWMQAGTREDRFPGFAASMMLQVKKTGFRLRQSC